MLTDAHTTAGLVCLAGLAIPVGGGLVIWFTGNRIKAWWNKRKHDN